MQLPAVESWLVDAASCAAVLQGALSTYTSSVCNKSNRHHPVLLLLSPFLPPPPPSGPRLAASSPPRTPLASLRALLAAGCGATMRRPCHATSLHCSRSGNNGWALLDSSLWQHQGQTAGVCACLITVCMSDSLCVHAHMCVTWAGRGLTSSNNQLGV